MIKINSSVVSKPEYNSTNSGSDIILELKGVAKKFDGNKVLSDINFSLESGNILGLVGENGAGKSTLMKILLGMPVIHETGGYHGKIFFDGHEIRFKSPFDALKAGIGMVHQEFSLIPGFDVSENIFLNMEKTRSNIISKIFGKKLEVLDNKFMLEIAREITQELGVEIDSKSLIENMPIGYKQFVEIAREINREQIKLLILDEPTAVLTEIEAEILLRAVKKIAAKNVAIIFISHRLQEIISVCDNLIVLRDGVIVREITCDDSLDVKQIAEWMIGRELDTNHVKKVQEQNDTRDYVLEVNNLKVNMAGERVRDVSFKVKRGEIFGIAGLAGQGKLGIANGIMGLTYASGQVLFNQKKFELNAPRKALENKFALVSEDRKGVGLLLDEPIDWNIAFNAMQIRDKFLTKILGIIKIRDEKAMRECAYGYIKAFDIKCVNEKQKVRNLSGGNQQKVCLAKAMCTEPEILFVCEPTRGIDIAAKKLILDALKKYNRDKNKTIIIISSELEELRSTCERIAVISEGKVTGILNANSSAVDFGLLMSNENINSNLNYGSNNFDSGVKTHE